MRKKFRDDCAAVDCPAIPEEDDVSLQVPQQMSEVLNDLNACDIRGMELHIESHPMAAWRNGDAGDNGDFVALVAVPQNGRLPNRGPRFSDIGNKKEPAFVEECQMSLKSLGFFLYGATSAFSTARWLFRLVEGLVFPVSESSIVSRWTSISKRGPYGSGRQTSSESGLRCV